MIYQLIRDAILNIDSRMTGFCPKLSIKIDIMVQAASMMVRFFLSGTPFCSGVGGALVWCRIPLSDRNFANLVFTYSLPLYVRRVLILLPVSSSVRL